MSWNTTLVMRGSGGIEHFSIPTRMKFMAVINNTDNTIQIYDDIRTVDDADVRDMVIAVAPYTALTVPLFNNSVNFTAMYISGAGTGVKAAKMYFDVVNPAINTQMGSSGATNNVVLQGDGVGLAKQTQLPAALVGGNLPVQVMNSAVPVSIAGEVEVKNDAGNPVPVMLAAKTAKKITAAAAGEQTVKASAGKVYGISGAADVVLMDGTGELWLGGGQFLHPINCGTNIKLKFAAAGDAYIIYE